MLGVGLGLAFLAGFGLGLPALVLALGICALAVARRSLSVWAVLGISAAVLLGVWHATVTDDRKHETPPSGAFEGVIWVEDGPYLTQSGQQFIARMEGDSRFLFCSYGPGTPSAFAGDRAFVKGRVIQLADLSDRGEASSRSRGCDGQLRIDSLVVVENGSGWRSRIAHARVDLSTVLMQAAPGDAGALLSGLVTGDDGGLTGDAYQAFVNSGTTHITAISGANFTLLLILLGVLLTGAARRSLAFVAAASGVIWLYAVFVGLQPSALRAALLATAVLVGRWIGRRPDLLTLTVLLAAVQIAIRPHDFGTLAFQLSLVATIALILVFDGSEERQRRHWFVSLCLAVIAAQLATIPLLAHTLGTVTGIGLVANLVVGQLAEIAFPIALVGGLVGQLSPPIGALVLAPAVALAACILRFVEAIDRHFPGAIALGAPTPGAMTMIFTACWATIFWMSGDVQRMARHVRSIVATW